MRTICTAVSLAMSILLAFILVVILSALTVICCYSVRRGFPPSRRALLLIAHPDDETMFFAPTIHGLRMTGTAVYILCLSTGNSKGQGVKRKYELANAVTLHKLSVNNLLILNYDRFQDGFVTWSKEELAAVVLRQIQILDVDTVVTFDNNGVSSHPNHIACFQALQYLYSNGMLPAGVQVSIFITDCWALRNIEFALMTSKRCISSKKIQRKYISKIFL